MLDVKLKIGYCFGDSAIFAAIPCPINHKAMNNARYINAHFSAIRSSALAFAIWMMCSISINCSISRFSSGERPCSEFLNKIKSIRSCHLLEVLNERTLRGERLARNCASSSKAITGSAVICNCIGVVAKLYNFFNNPVRIEVQTITFECDARSRQYNPFGFIVYSRLLSGI